MRERWKRVKFGDFLRPNTRPYTLGSDEDANLVGMRLYGKGPFHRELKPALRIAKKSHFVIRSGDIIYNKLFAWKGTFGIVPPELDGMFVSDKFPTYELDRTRVEDSYLRWYFRMPELWTQAQAMSTGSAALSKLTLNPPKFLLLDIPLPSLIEQQRIVARLDEISTNIAEALRLRVVVAEETAALISNSRRLAFGSESRADWIPLSTYVSHIENGKSPATEGRSAEPDQWAVLKVGAVSRGYFDAAENKALPSSFVPLTQFEVQSGDFLMSRANTRELVGACAIVAKTRPRLMLSDKIFRFVFRRPAAVDPEYLDLALKSPALRDQIMVAATGTSPTMKNISKEKVLSLRIPPHTIEQQRQIVAKLSNLTEKVMMVRSHQTRCTAGLSALLPSILDRAFKGEF